MHKYFFLNWVTEWIAAFFDEELFKTCERLNIGYLCGGKLYANIIQAAEETTDCWTYTIIGQQGHISGSTKSLCADRGARRELAAQSTSG